MDAVKYIKEFKRMCGSHPDCSDGCPLKRRCGLLWNTNVNSESIEAIVAIVEKWSKEHPIKTNGERFLDDNREYIRTYHRWDNGCKPYIEVHIEADWWDAEYKEESNG